MKTYFSLTLCLLLILGLTNSSHTAHHEEENKETPNYDNRKPERFDKAIQRFKNTDKENPPPEGAIVGIGSSSMAGWRHTIREDLSPLTIIPRGFGGSNMNDALHFADDIVIAYNPRAVILYEGDNDMMLDISLESYKEKFDAFVTKIHTALPQTRIYVLSIKPSIARWKVWPRMQSANKLLEEACKTNELLTYIDIGTVMLNKQGNPKKEIFKKDMLHMNEKGYALWTNAVRPIVLKTELQYEQASTETK